MEAMSYNTFPCMKGLDAFDLALLSLRLPVVAL